jgi:hypothetical protein
MAGDERRDGEGAVLAGGGTMNDDEIDGSHTLIDS